MWASSATHSNTATRKQRVGCWRRRKTLGEMSRIAVSDYIDASLAAVFVLVVVATVIYGLIAIRRALGNPRPTVMEIGLAGVALGGGHA